MAKKRKAKKAAPEPNYSNYPIKTLFQMSMFAGALAFVLAYFHNRAEFIGAIFKGFIFFVSVASLGGLVLITSIIILSKLRDKETEAMRSKIEEEQKEFIEAQMRLQEEIDKLSQEFNENDDVDELPDVPQYSKSDG